MPATEEYSQNQYFGGRLLAAMPAMQDGFFEHSLVLLVDHSSQGAMGLVLNKPLKSPSFAQLCTHLSIAHDNAPMMPVLFGGPVEGNRGFVLHSPDYVCHGTSKPLADGVLLSATKNVIEDIAENRGPKNAVIAMGYAGWSPGQLDAEITRNDWLVLDGSYDMIFAEDFDQKWQRAIIDAGIDPRLLSTAAGRA